MTTLAVLCSGQGAQGPGMFDLVTAAPEACDVFAAATRALGGRDPRDLVASGRDVDLHANRVAQVLCVTQALAFWSVLQPKLDARIVVAGYSVGEVAAWGVAGALASSSVIEVTAKRAALMDAATKAPSGLLAVRGLSRPIVDRLCLECDVHVAIRNAPDRLVLGGTLEALDRARDTAQKIGAAGVTPISVDVPSHTPLLRGAAEQFGEWLRSLENVKAPPRARLLSGVNGEAVYDVQDGLAKLGRQVAQTVDWEACLDSCRSFGTDRSIELGPGNSLSRMMGDVVGARDSRSIADFRSLEGLLRWIAC